MLMMQKHTYLVERSPSSVVMELSSSSLLTCRLLAAAVVAIAVPRELVAFKSNCEGQRTAAACYHVILVFGTASL
jgi:hypothetical protein